MPWFSSLALWLPDTTELQSIEANFQILWGDAGQLGHPMMYCQDCPLKDMCSKSEFYIFLPFDV